MPKNYKKKRGNGYIDKKGKYHGNAVMMRARTGGRRHAGSASSAGEIVGALALLGALGGIGYAIAKKVKGKGRKRGGYQRKGNWLTGTSASKQQERFEKAQAKAHEEMMKRYGGNKWVGAATIGAVANSIFRPMNKIAANDARFYNDLKNNPGAINPLLKADPALESLRWDPIAQKLF